MPSNYSQCGNCPYNNANSLMPLSLEDNGSDVLLVFQAPGNDEWNGSKRKPIISTKKGSCGKKMQKVFVNKRCCREDYDITEAIQCYPGKGNNGRDKKPRKKSIESCKKFHLSDLQKKKYIKIVCFGVVAYNLMVDVVNEFNKQNQTFQQPNPLFVPHPCSHISAKDLSKLF